MLGTGGAPAVHSTRSLCSDSRLPRISSASFLPTSAHAGTERPSDTRSTLAARVTTPACSSDFSAASTSGGAWPYRRLQDDLVEAITDWGNK